MSNVCQFAENIYVTHGHCVPPVYFFFQFFFLHLFIILSTLFARRIRALDSQCMHACDIASGRWWSLLFAKCSHFHSTIRVIVLNANTTSLFYFYLCVFFLHINHLYVSMLWSHGQRSAYQFPEHILTALVERVRSSISSVAAIERNASASIVVEDFYLLTLPVDWNLADFRKMCTTKVESKWISECDKIELSNFLVQERRRIRTPRWCNQSLWASVAASGRPVTSLMNKAYMAQSHGTQSAFEHQLNIYIAYTGVVWSNSIWAIVSRHRMNPIQLYFAQPKTK